MAKDCTPSLYRQLFFDNQVHQESWKKNMSGKNETKVKEIIEALGYKFGEDFVPQHPIGERFVIDFAFVPLRVAIEVDGKSHDEKKQKRLDKMRDKYLYDNGWVPMRIKDKDFFDSYKMGFYKNLIKEIVEERKVQRQNGDLYPIDIPNFNEQDYE